MSQLNIRVSTVIHASLVDVEKNDNSAENSCVQFGK